VRYANDVQALWYLRGDLMATLSAMQGEVQAREQILKLTACSRPVARRAHVAPQFADLG
jgi:hypothetical protein